MTSKERRRLRTGMPALDLIEDAVRLLRRTPIEAYLAYLLGAIPFWLVLFYFVSDMTQNAYAPSHVSEAALGVSLMFGWMKCWQTVFAARLRTTLTGRAALPWTGARIGRMIAIQTFWQPVGLVLRIVAAHVILPYVWVAAFCQNLSILGDGADDENERKSIAARAWAQARHWPGQAHGASGAVWIFILFVWININAALGFMPAALKMFFGLETAFSRSPESMLNSTFLVISLGLTILVVDPLWKAIFAVRCFHGLSLRTGEDLLVELRQSAAPSRSLAVVAMAFLLVAGTLDRSAHAADGAPPSAPQLGVNATSVEAPKPELARKLDDRISDVLERREYAWRAPRENIAGSGGGLLAGWMDGGIRALKRIKVAMQETVEAFWNAIFGKRSIRGAGLSLRALPDVLLAVAVLIVGSALFWILRMILKRGRDTTVAIARRNVVPDLHSDEVMASQLPEDEWIALARQYATGGELTLALRAAWLACLAHLGERELLSIARYKSNRDYETELRRRARTREDLLSAFGQNLLAFERAWYGRHEVRPDDFSAFEANLEHIRAC